MITNTKKPASVKIPYPVQKALATAMWQAKDTARQVSENIDAAKARLNEPAGKPVALKNPNAPASYDACKYLSYLLAKIMTPEAYKNLIAAYDKKTGYTPKPKQEQPKKEPKAKKPTYAEMIALLQKQSEQLAALTAAIAARQGK